MIATTLATALGALLARAVATLGGWPTVAGGARAAQIMTATLVAAVLTAAATVPIIRTRLTADLLRQRPRLWSHR